MLAAGVASAILVVVAYFVPWRPVAPGDYAYVCLGTYTVPLVIALINTTKYVGQL